jgi:broad specificity phosphatase PhoE
MIYLIRHGRTILNDNDILQCDTDIGLNNTGLQQAKKNGLWLSKQKINAILTSPQGRTIETANIIKSYVKCDMFVSDLLTERNIGIYEGMDTNHLTEFREKAKHDFVDPTQDWNNIGNVESDTKIFCRVAKCYSMHISKFPNHKNIAIITHAGVIKSLLHKLFQVDPTRGNCFKAGNGSIFTISALDPNSSRLIEMQQC